MVEALKKWAGWIGLQPVVITRDHKSLEDWVHEKMDTPSGPAGRRARLHEILSKFDLTVQYVPGKDNVVADAMSRFAYPACKTFQDESRHGSVAARAEVKQIIEEEIREGRTVGMIAWEKDPTGSSLKWANVLMVAGTIAREAELPPSRVSAITWSGRDSAPGLNPRAEPFVPGQESRRGAPTSDECPAPKPDQGDQFLEPVPAPARGWGGRGRPQEDTQPVWRQGEFVDDPMSELEEE